MRNKTAAAKPVNLHAGGSAPVLVPVRGVANPLAILGKLLAVSLAARIINFSLLTNNGSYILKLGMVIIYL